MCEFVGNQLDSVIGRRDVLVGGAALGLGAALPLAAQAQGAPQKGGTLRIGMSGGSASDSLDPRTYADMIMVGTSLMLWNQLVEVADNGDAVGELATSWETKPGAKEWIFNLRKDITFASGKTFDADDVIYSIGLHMGETKSSAKVLLQDVSEIKKLSPTQVQFTLKNGDADFPYILTDWHLVMVPKGFTNWSKPDGTGAFALESFQPGIRSLFKRKPGAYWKPGRGNFDAVELRYLLDNAARTQALLTGQVDVVNRVDPKAAGAFAKSPKHFLSRTSAAGQRFCFVAHVDKDPYRNRDVMLSLKYGIDRQKIVQNVFSGYATPGVDHLVGPTQKFYNKNLKPYPYDPEKAKFHLKKSGYTGPVELQVSEGAFPGATDAAVVFQESYAKAGGKLSVKRVSGDGYWDNVWPKVPFCAVFWAPRATVDLQLTLAFASDAAWNDTHYHSPEVDKLLKDARVELNVGKRQGMYNRIQQLIHEEAGMITFVVSDYLDAASKRLKGLTPSARYDMGDQRIAEKGWFA